MDYQDLFFEVIMSTYNQKADVMELTLSPEAYELLKGLCKAAAKKEIEQITDKELEQVAENKGLTMGFSLIEDEQKAEREAVDNILNLKGLELVSKVETSEGVKFVFTVNDASPIDFGEAENVL